MTISRIDAAQFTSLEDASSIFVKLMPFLGDPSLGNFEDRANDDDYRRTSGVESFCEIYENAYNSMTTKTDIITLSAYVILETFVNLLHFTDFEHANEQELAEATFEAVTSDFDQDIREEIFKKIKDYAFAFKSNNPFQFATL